MLVSFTESHCFHQSLYGLMDYRNNNFEKKFLPIGLTLMGVKLLPKRLE